MHALALLAFVAVGAEALPNPQGPIYTNPALFGAFFDFAPASGAGMGGTACACTTPTGAKGEVMTFARASSATCLKGNTTTGIAAGDMVTCTTNQARVMPGGDGSGGLGLLVEGVRTNLMLRSQEFDNAAWSKEAGVSVVADSANCPLAPDGTQTMDLVTFGGANNSGVFQIVAGLTAATNVSHSVFLAKKTGGAACTLNLTDGASGNAGDSVALSSTITRLTHSQAIAGTTGGVYLRETLSGDCVDACVWGGMTEQVAPFPSSYIATAGATATRAAEPPNFAGVATSGVQALGSTAVTFVPEWGGASSAAYLVYFDANGRPLYNNTGAALNVFDGTNDNSSGAYTFVANTATRAYSYWGSPLHKDTICVATTCNTNATFDDTMGAGAAGVSIGNGGGANSFGVIKQLCLDPDPMRCR